MWKTVLLPISLASLFGCSATTGPAEVRTETRIIDTACQWTKPIRIDRSADVLTDGTADQIRAHNEAGAARCGWRPKGK
jgi:type IV pilus biogenesis protein CpaD/CtpE